MIGFVSLELLISVRIVCWHLKQVSLTWDHSGCHLLSRLETELSLESSQFVRYHWSWTCGQRPVLVTANSYRTESWLSRTCSGQREQVMFIKVQIIGMLRTVHPITLILLYHVSSAYSSPKWQMWDALWEMWDGVKNEAPCEQSRESG